MKFLFSFALVLLLGLVACGSSTEPPLLPTSTSAPTVAVIKTPTAVGAIATATKPASVTTPTSSSSMGVTPGADNTLDEGLLLSGTDPDTGLEINPENFVANSTFIVRGQIISVNVAGSPPEFLIQAQNGKRYRIQTQPSEEIFYADGSVILPYQFQNRMMVQATVKSGNAATDVPTTSDFVVLSNP